jgi:hypothetical protein
LIPLLLFLFATAALVGLFWPLPLGWYVVISFFLCVVWKLFGGPSKNSPSRNVVIATGSTVLSLLLAELALRLTLPLTSFHYRPEDALTVLSSRFKSVERLRSETRFHGEVYGNLGAFSGTPLLREPRVTTFTVDRHGFRNQVDRSTPFDILLLGDSFGLGSGSSDDQILPAILAHESGRRVYNLSLPGSPADQLLNLSLELPELPLSPSPVLLWLLFAGNDLDDSFDALNLYQSDLELSLSEGLSVSWRNFAKSARISLLVRSLFTFPRKHLIIKGANNPEHLCFKPWIVSAGRSRVELVQHPNFSAYSKTITTLTSFSNKNKLRLIVAVVPTKSLIYGEQHKQTNHFAALTCELLRKNAPTSPCIDLTPYFRRESKRLLPDTGPVLWWKDDTHWSHEGHRYAADVLLPFLTPAAKDQ